MTAQLFLIRHGETDWSLTGRHTGLSDLPLTAHGEQQATQLRARLIEIKFTHVFTSPLRRARQTCAGVGLDAAAAVEPDLREWNYGDYEGLTSPEIHARQPGWNVFLDGCPQGESTEQISQRADRLLANLRSMTGPVALFSHGHFLRALAMRWIDLPVAAGRHFALTPASVSILGYEHADQAMPAIRLWNCPEQ